MTALRSVFDYSLLYIQLYIHISLLHIKHYLLVICVAKRATLKFGIKNHYIFTVHQFRLIKT